MNKKILTFTAILLVCFISENYAQLARNSWSFGFGFTYPRMINPNITKTSENYGGYLSIQRNFSEHVGLRLKVNYISMKGLSGTTDVISNAVTGDINLLFYLVPCESVSPFFNIGFGGVYASYDNPIPATLTSQLDYELNIGFGVEWILDTDWKLKTEIGYTTTNDDVFDGATGVSTGGLLGTLDDAYMTVDFGIQIYFGKGELSKYCQLYEGITVGEMPDQVDYERIENIVKKYIPREVVKEVVVEKPVEADHAKPRWVLVGVNFEFNNARLSPEAYPVLFHAVQVLLQNPDIKIEVQGYTDDIGSEESNRQLSLKRAVAVRDYLVARGVGADRITTVGYGESKPVADNKTANGRAMNRRIEFKVMK